MLIIAHRLSTVKNCDEIIVLDNGEIAEQGTHEELLGKQGMYYRLWNMQQGNFVIEDEKSENGFEVEDDGIDDEDTLCYT